MNNAIKLSYVLPDPTSYSDWEEFEGDLVHMKQVGYDAVELQITDPAAQDEARLRRTLDKVGFPLCAMQSGGSYATRGNCLCTANVSVRERTISLLKTFVDFASRWGAVIVFGSLQGRAKDEPDLEAGRQRIVDAMGLVGRYATEKEVIVAFEPVNHIEVAYHNSIDSVAEVVRRVNTPGLRMMIDTFHMNIEERDMLKPIAPIRDILAHAHLSETNRDVLGTGHWNTGTFLRELKRVGYAGYCSVGVYNSRLPRRGCISRCIEVTQRLRKT
jgi:sugar phosphate isomerase/epimerase